ncbi:hypothetical protein GGI21_002603 [Coemansia aciculifera]|nr:hypothetical protein GGI21_002603 [Coemansia aciculifera]
MTSPLGADEPLCKHTVPFPTPCATWTAGQSVNVVFASGGAPHGGGHCEFSLSYDGGKTFVVVYQVLGHCFGPDQSVRQYSIPLPAGLPSSNTAVFAWTWVNAIGNREFYMNCADVVIQGGSAPYTGKQMTIANHNGYPTIPEFDGNYDTGLQYYNNATTITVTGSGSSSNGGGNSSNGGGSSQYNPSPQVPVAHTPSYSSSAAPSVSSPSYPATTVTPAAAYSMTPIAVSVSVSSSVSSAAYSTAPQAMTTTAGPVVPTASPTPYSAAAAGSGGSTSCDGSALRCSPSDTGYQYCLNGSWSPSYACGPGTACKANGSSITCDWP